MLEGPHRVPGDHVSKIGRKSAWCARFVKVACPSPSRLAGRALVGRHEHGAVEGQRPRHCVRLDHLRHPVAGRELVIVVARGCRVSNLLDRQYLHRPLVGAVGDELREPVGAVVRQDIQMRGKKSAQRIGHDLHDAASPKSSAQAQPKSPAARRSYSPHLLRDVWNARTHEEKMHAADKTLRRSGARVSGSAPSHGFIGRMHFFFMGSRIPNVY